MEKLTAIIHKFEDLIETNAKNAVLQAESSKRMARALERLGVIDEGADS